MDETTKSGNSALTSWQIKGKGGFKAASFLYVLAALDNMGFVANMVSLVLYFHVKLHFDIPTASNTLTNFMGSTFLLSIVGGFISDTYINRLHTSLIFGLLEVLALILMTIQARFTSLQPEVCTNNKGSCMEGNKALLFYVSLCALALGSGGVRGALPALGADQFDHTHPKEAKAFASYFNYLLFSTTAGATIGVTFIVWLTTEKGWWWVGFLISVVGVIVGFAVLAAGKPFYRLQTPGGGPLLRIIQVIFVSIKNRKLRLPENDGELYEMEDKGSSSYVEEEKLLHTDQFRFLDKAAIVTENNTTPWTVCTVTQVEEVKVLIRMLPIIGSTILMNTCLAQLQTFSVLQGYRMDLQLGSIKMAPSSVPVIPLLFMTLLIPLYDRVFVPLARTLTHHPSGITQLQRVGVGLVLSVVSMAVAALVEIKRKRHSLRDPLHPIHVLWLGFQYGIFGIADMFTLVGLLEFFYKEAPSGMRSLSTSFTWISLSFGYFLSSVFVDVINAVTKKVGSTHRGWLESNDLDQNKLNFFYWFLAVLSAINFAVYLLMASWYKYKSEDNNKPITIPLSVSKSGVPFLKDPSKDETPSSISTGQPVEDNANTAEKKDDDK
ncbi:protein NRT1/ PTR FAMILY 4.6-like [Ipomoea triloba]|uniref:protein NRT1/ PTR FAMILY 4.6-like n=1 Tax=Ipomoea triloba TaxID=35885 RepID=UPI00125E917E|nr:protein NRT1/ PTR FAMILY 4.6-like [Ipomoea triloba]